MEKTVEGMEMNRCAEWRVTNRGEHKKRMADE